MVDENVEVTEVAEETTSTAPVEAPVSEESNPKAWAALVRKEAHLTKQSAELRAMENTLRERESKLTSMEATLKAAENKAEKTESKTDEDRVTRLEKELSEWKANLQKREAEIEAEVNMSRLQKMEYDYIHGTLKPTAEKNMEKFELVLANDAVDLALNVIKEHHNTTGGMEDPLTPEEALGMVEEYLREQADKIANTSYIKSKFNSAPKEEPEQDPPNKQKKKALKTVGNNSSRAPEEKPVSLSSDERWNALVKKHMGAAQQPPGSVPKKGK